MTLYRSHISQLARGLICPPDTVSTEQIERWCAQQQWASETRRSAYIVYGQFFTHLHERTGVANPARSLASPPPPPRPPCATQGRHAKPWFGQSKALHLATVLHLPSSWTFAVRTLA